MERVPRRCQGGGGRQWALVFACFVALTVLLTHQALAARERQTILVGGQHRFAAARATLADVIELAAQQPGAPRPLLNDCPAHQGALPLLLVALAGALLFADQQRLSPLVPAASPRRVPCRGTPARRRALLRVFRI